MQGHRHNLVSPCDTLVPLAAGPIRAASQANDPTSKPTEGSKAVNPTPLGGLFAEEQFSVLKTDDADVTYLDCFLSESDADSALEAASRESYLQEKITIRGRTHDVPRLTRWYSRDGSRYTYSGIAMSPQPYPPYIEHVSDRVCQHTGLSFNSVLVNLYRDGRDKVGWHSDDEPELGRVVDIASVSLGVSRTFRLRHRSDHSRTVAIMLTHGSLLVMRHPTQFQWQHCLPPRNAVTQPRYNLTFRRIEA